MNFRKDTFHPEKTVMRIDRDIGRKEAGDFNILLEDMRWSSRASILELGGGFTLKNIVVPEGIETVRFCYNNKIRKLTLPESCTKIDFGHYNNISEVIFNGIIKSIKLGSCNNYWRMSIPSGVEMITVVDPIDTKLRIYKTLPDTVKTVILPDLYQPVKLTIPESTNRLILHNVGSGVRIRNYENITQLNIGTQKLGNIIELPRGLKELSLGEHNLIDDLQIPDTLETIHLGNNNTIGYFNDVNIKNVAFGFDNKVEFDTSKYLDISIPYKHIEHLLVRHYIF